MRKQIGIFIFIIFFSVSAWGADCLQYEPHLVKITGLLTQETFPGEPNYQDIAKGDKPETVLLVKLPQAICVEGGKDPLHEKENSVTLVQLVLSTDQYQAFKSKVGKTATVSGSLFHSHTGHHHTKILLKATGVE